VGVSISLSATCYLERLARGTDLPAPAAQLQMYILQEALGSYAVYNLHSPPPSPGVYFWDFPPALFLFQGTQRGETRAPLPPSH